MKSIRLIAAVAGTFVGITLAHGQTPPAPAGPAAPTTTPAQAAEKAPQLGPIYQGAADITFYTPPDCKEINRPLNDEFVRCYNESKRWLFTAGRFELEKSIPLKDYRPKDNSAPGGLGPMTKGYLTLALQTVLADSPDAVVLRQPETLDMGNVRIGVFAVRMFIEGRPTLVQQALVQVTDSRYYALTFRSPSENEKPEEDPAVREAVGIFGGIVDSINVLDLKAVRANQDERLFATRALFYNWNVETVTKSLVKEQWLRFVQDGKDIGYAHVFEEPADAIPHAGEKRDAVPAKPKGIRVGQRSRTVGKDGISVDAESWMFVTFDRAHEVWSNLAVTKDPTQPDARQRESWFTEVGASDKQFLRIFDTKPGQNGQVPLGDDRDKLNPQQRTVEQYKMMVRTESKSAVAPAVDLQPPPFYLPQALSQILPRLVPLNDRKGYLFASYLSEQRAIALRFVDVMPETTTMINGKSQRAVPVVERVGRVGSPTTHYMTPDGKYLGSTNEGARIQILPTDLETLKKIWKDEIDASRPKDVQDPAIPAAPADGDRR